MPIHPEERSQQHHDFPIHPILLSVFCSVPDIITKIVAMQYINFSSSRSDISYVFLISTRLVAIPSPFTNRASLISNSQYRLNNEPSRVRAPSFRKHVCIVPPSSLTIVRMTLYAPSAISKTSSTLSCSFFLRDRNLRQAINVSAALLASRQVRKCGLSRLSRNISISPTSLSYPAKQYRFSLSFFIFRYRSSSCMITAYRIAYSAIEKLSLYTILAFSSKVSYAAIRLRDLSSRYCAILTPLATTFVPAPAKSENPFRHCSPISLIGTISQLKYHGNIAIPNRHIIRRY